MKGKFINENFLGIFIKKLYLLFFPRVPVQISKRYFCLVQINKKVDTRKILGDLDLSYARHMYIH